MSGPFVPERGQVVWLRFNPQSGREQDGRRPSLVLSPAAYNGRARLALVCPITSQEKGYPFEVRLPTGLPIHGVVLADHLKSVDWQARRAEYICEAPAVVLREVTARLRPLLGIP